MSNFLKYLKQSKKFRLVKKIPPNDDSNKSPTIFSATFILLVNNDSICNGKLYAVISLGYSYIYLYNFLSLAISNRCKLQIIVARLKTISPRSPSILLNSCI